METQGKIVIMVIITITMGQAKEDLETMKEMMAKMKIEMDERLSLTEGKLAKAEVDLAATKDGLIVALNDLAITKAKSDELEREMENLRAAPYINVCGSHYDQLSTSSGTIPYTSLLYSSTNAAGGGLDITTGVFTAPHPGTYTVYWDTSAHLVSAQDVQIFLQKNGENIQESHHVSVYTGDAGLFDQGKLSLILVTVLTISYIL